MATDASAKSTSRPVYIQSFERKLIHKQTQLEYIKRKIKRAAGAGRIGPSEQLRNAEKRADSALASVNERLQHLKDASDDSWEQLKNGIDMAWDDLSQSIKEIVYRFS